MNNVLSRGRLVAAAVFSFCCLVIVIATPGDGMQLAGVDVHLPSPLVELERIRAEAPFKVKQPQWLPDGIRLYHVVETPPENESSDTYSVDLWFRSDDRRELHVWQTNAPTLTASGKDPLLQPGGEAEAVANDEVWIIDRTLYEPHLTALSHRFSDQITLSFDGDLAEDVLKRIAASFPGS